MSIWPLRPLQPSCAAWRQTGVFGSDGVTYIATAFHLLDGDWTVSSYVGANRLGVNLPVAAFAQVFGRTVWDAALYSLLTSLGEVALAARSLFRQGCISGPVHRRN